jgi:hypothetical protein
VHAPLAALIGSRFQDLGDDTALDLATGGRVWLVRRTLDQIDRAVWPREIDTLAALWHPAVAPCLDFGWTSRGDWFEAYAAEGCAERHGGSAAAFLQAHAVNCVLVRRDAGRTALPLIPALPDDPGAVRLATADRGMGLRLAPRAIERTVATAIAEGRLGGPLIWSIDAPRGSGWRTTWRRLARHARQWGYVPIDAGLLEMPAAAGTPGSWLGVLSGTPLVVVFEQQTWHTTRRRQLAHLLVRLGGLDTPSTVVLDVVRMGRPRAAPHRLEGIEADVLAEALWVPRGCSPHWLRARQTAVVTGGQPGLFVEAIAQRLGLRPPGDTVHERPEVFGAVVPGVAPERASRRSRAARPRRRRGATSRANDERAAASRRARRTGAAAGGAQRGAGGARRSGAVTAGLARGVPDR